jgi:hypothetical protein
MKTFNPTPSTNPQQGNRLVSFGSENESVVSLAANSATIYLSVD